MKLREMLKTRQLFVPCVYDCLSAQAARQAGYLAVLLSGGALSYSIAGVPDMAMLTFDELVCATERVARVGLPVIVDGDDGYGESPAVVYHRVRGLIRAGAQAVTIDDTTGIRGFERYVYSKAYPEKDPFVEPVVSRESWLSKIKAAVYACQDTDCMVIVRTEAYSAMGWEEVLIRCRQARRLGAEMTLICDGLETLEDARTVNQADPGWKMWPDIYSVNGVPNVELSDIRPLGFSLVSFHIFEKAAMYGMLRFGREESPEEGAVEKRIEMIKNSMGEL